MKTKKILVIGAVIMLFMICSTTLTPATKIKIEHKHILIDEAETEHILIDEAEIKKIKTVTGTIESVTLNSRGHLISFVVNGITIIINQNYDDVVLSRITNKIINAMNNGNEVRVTYNAKNNELRTITIYAKKDKSQVYSKEINGITIN